jgi:hypothetical protein
MTTNKDAFHKLIELAAQPSYPLAPVHEDIHWQL